MTNNSEQLTRIENMLESLICAQALILQNHQQAVEIIANCARMIEGANPDPEAAAGLIDELREELARLK